MTALLGPCAQSGIRIQAVGLNERVQPALRNRIRALQHDEFDLVFFSPFSHAYLPEYELLLKPKAALWPPAKIASHLDSILKEVCATLTAMAQHFQCPIYVHNTAGTIQSFGRVSGVVKNLTSLGNRRHARRTINERIAQYLQDPQLDGRVRLLDEHSVRRENSDLALGQVMFNSNAYHPTRLGVELGRSLYFEAVYNKTFLATKKVVRATWITRSGTG